MDTNSIRTGTSGWHYNHWLGPFYPADLSKNHMLSMYAEHFDTVEINNSFYRQPSDETLADWRETVPPGFIFAYKASRFITHMKKLNDPENPIRNLIQKVTILKEKLGPILFQLPPGFNFNPGKLRTFLSALPPGFRYAFEFRDKTWHTDEAFNLLAEHGASFCIYSMGTFTTPLAVTSNLVYIRFHGPSDTGPASYPEEYLKLWAINIAAWKNEGKEVFCYFNNDINGYAVKDAKALTSLVNEILTPA